MTMLVRGGAAAGGAALPATATTGQVLQWNGSAWVAATPSASGTTPNATPTVPGLVQLAGDLGGTATAPTVAKINGAAPAAVATSGAYTDLTGRPALATVATSGAYADLTGRPALATVATSGAYTDLTGRPALAAVATTGSYGDLTGRPLLAAVATTGAYTDLTGRPTTPTEYLLGKATGTPTTSTTYALDPDLQIANLPVGTYALTAFFTVPPAGNSVTTSSMFSGGTATYTGSYVNNGTAATSFTTALLLSATGRSLIGATVFCTAAGSWGVNVGSGTAGSTAGLGAGSWLRLTKLF